VRKLVVGILAKKGVVAAPSETDGTVAQFGTDSPTAVPTNTPFLGFPGVNS
jgi:hypothetical protein